jgi:hypothetical protein
MKALRISLILVGCGLIALNIVQVALGEPNQLPVDAGFFKILEVYVSKLYFLFAGILLAALGSNINAKAKTKHLA